jgi:hypothetical protein
VKRSAPLPADLPSPLCTHQPPAAREDERRSSPNQLCYLRPPLPQIWPPQTFHSAVVRREAKDAVVPGLQPSGVESPALLIMKLDLRITWVLGRKFRQGSQIRFFAAHWVGRLYRSVHWYTLDSLVVLSPLAPWWPRAALLGQLRIRPIRIGRITHSWRKGKARKKTEHGNSAVVRPPSETRRRAQLNEKNGFTRPSVDHHNRSTAATVRDLMKGSSSGSRSRNARALGDELFRWTN